MENQTNQIQANDSKIVLAVISSLVTAVIVGGIIYWWQKNTLDYLVDKDTLQQTQATVPAYRTVNAVGNPDLSFEVPSSWSVTKIPESVGENELSSLPTLSVGQTDVQYGDFNWSQVDFYFVQNDIVASLVGKHTAGNPQATVSTETVAGLQVQVFTSPLDNGEVTKFGTGGKHYYVRLPDSEFGLKTLYINKQAKGDAAFEAGFNHLIQTLKIHNQLLGSVHEKPSTQQSIEVSSNLTQYTNKELDVNFSYPKAWGDVKVNDFLTMTTLTFSGKNVGTFQFNKIDALGRGGTPADPLIKFAGNAPSKYPAKEVVDIGNGKKVSIWIDYDTCWDVSSQERKNCEEFYITPLPAAASLPFERTGYESGIGVYLTDKSSQSVEDFKIMMRSFQFIP